MIVILFSLLFITNIIIILCLSNIIDVDNDPYNFQCTRSNRINQQCRWCNREFPSINGMWYGVPPYWQTLDCPIQYYNTEQTKQCMKHRTLYVIGNTNCTFCICYVH